MINQPAPRQFTGGQFLFWMVFSFAVVFLANGALVYTALISYSGDVTHGTPKSGLRMMQVLPEPGNLAGSSVSMDQEGTNLIFTIEGTPAPAMTAQAKLTRAVSAKADRDLTLVAAGENRWTASLTDVPPGRWQVEIFFYSDSHQLLFARTGRLELP
jgi:nitrogen fixation protein FixH